MPHRTPVPGLDAWLRSPHVVEHLRPFLEWVLRRHAALGGATEIRVLRKVGGPGVWAALFQPEHLDQVVEALAPPPAGPRRVIPRGDHPRVGEANFYFSLQAVRPNARLLGRGFRRARTATRDVDVVAYTLMAVDIDPERSPRGRSASDAEKAEALAVARRVREWFQERGAESLLADSGNGYHLLVPLVAATGEDVAQAARDASTLLRQLDRLFSTPGAKVDTSTFNPSRILKLYGTKAIKGEDTPEHPHRFASIDLSVIPEDVDLFACLAAEEEERAAQGGSAAGSAREAQSSSPAAKAPPEPPRLPGSENEAGAPVPGKTSPAVSKENAAWKDWRGEALARLPLEAVYGSWLTGKASGQGWLQCRDPASESGDRNPSAGVADGSGEAERASFHSFRTGRTVSVFDFLVERGCAPGFQEACALVAELSGVPLPPRSRQAGRAALERLRQGWASTEDEEARDELVAEALAAAARFNALQQQRALEEIRTVTSLPMKVLRQVMAEVTRARRQEERRRRGDARSRGVSSHFPVVDYVQNEDTVQALFGALVKSVRPARRFFQHEGNMVFVRRGFGPVAVGERNAAGLLSSLVEIRFLVATDEGHLFQRFDVLPGDLSRAFVHSPRVLAGLPRLKMYARSPVFDQEWRFVGRPGYHEASGIFYDGPAVEPRQGVEHLDRALRDFHWKGEADLVNFVGALLTALTMPHWGRGHPFLAINGNKPGVGKSTLARVLGAVVEGSEPNSISFTPDDTEFEKQLATRVEAGDRVLVIDNARTRRPIQSAVLERCITDSRLNFRRLGSNTAITRSQNDLLFCLTMNMTQLGADLRRRALPLNLELAESVRDACYPVDDLVGWVLEHRLVILGELAGMVMAWVDAGRPECERPARHSTSQRWAATIDAILRMGGFDGFLANFEESEHAFDPRYQLVLEIVRAHRDKPPSPASRWVEWLEAILEDRFKDRRGNPRSARAKATVVGSLFRDYLDARFTVEGRRYEIVRSYPDGATHPPTYGFREVGR